MTKNFININANERKIEITPRALLGILGDENADRVYFKCQKIVGDNIDLSQLQLYVKYAVSNRRGTSFTGKTQIYHCEDVEDCGEYITFSWRMSGNVFNESGFVAYSILAANGETVRWNTYPAIGTVGMTVPGGLEEIAEEHQDVITQLLERMDSLEKEGVPTELVEQLLNEYLKENPIETPEELPNPHKLSFTGAVTAEYDGSEAVEVEIPECRNLVINFSEDASGNMIADKTFSQIVEAYNAGFNISAVLVSDGETIIFPLLGLICTGEFSSDGYDAVIFSVTHESTTFVVIGMSDGSNDMWNEDNVDIMPTTLPNPYKLTFDGAVQAEYDGSGAVRVTIPNGQGTARVGKDATDTDVTIEPNKLYVFPEMEALNITLSDKLDAAIANEYHFTFKSGETATTLTLPDTINTPDGFTIDVNKIYEISIMENCLMYQSWEVS